VQTKIAVKDVRRIKEKRLLIVDDISDTGGTLITASAMLREHGAGYVSALVSHVPSLSVLRERVGGVLPVEALHDQHTSHSAMRGKRLDSEPLKRHIRHRPHLINASTVTKFSHHL
jgi:phosphoribosylpyrophosphate synthetase